MRQILRGPEFNGDVLLSLDGPFVQEGGLEAPLADGADGSRQERGRAAHEFYVRDCAKPADGGAHLY